MSERFIKFIPSQKADWLQENYPFAFLLLCLIARRARRTAGHFDGICVGEALIGDHKSAGLTRQQYRTALKVLCDNKLIEILTQKRNCKISTIKTTIRGTLVKILDTTIWDINSELINHQPNHQSTINQPSINHEQERTKKEKESLHKGNVALEKTNVPVTASLPFSKKKKNQRLNEKQQEAFEWLLTLDLNSDEDTLRYWAKTWEREKIEKAYCFMLMESKKKKIKNPGGFIREILKGTIIVVDDASIANMESAKRFSHQHPELNLKLNEKYVYSEKVTDTDIYYYLPSQDFERQLEALCNKAYAYL